MSSDTKDVLRESIRESVLNTLSESLAREFSDSNSISITQLSDFMAKASEQIANILVSAFPDKFDSDPDTSSSIIESNILSPSSFRNHLHEAYDPSNVNLRGLSDEVESIFLELLKSRQMILLIDSSSTSNRTSAYSFAKSLWDFQRNHSHEAVVCITARRERSLAAPQNSGISQDNPESLDEDLIEDNGNLEELVSSIDSQFESMINRQVLIDRDRDEIAHLNQQLEDLLELEESL